MRRRGAGVGQPRQLNFTLSEKCEGCGNQLRHPDLSEGVTGKVSRLAQFGLAAGGGPLLEPARRPHSLPEPVSKDY